MSKDAQICHLQGVFRIKRKDISLQYDQKSKPNHH